MVQIVAYSSLATCNIFSDSYPNLCCLQNTVQEAAPPTKTFNTQCPVCPLNLLSSSLSWVFSYRVWWRVLVSCRFQSSCVCPVSPSCILSPGGTTSERVLQDEAWLRLLVHKLTNYVLAAELGTFFLQKHRQEFLYLIMPIAWQMSFSYFLWNEMFLSLIIWSRIFPLNPGSSLHMPVCCHGGWKEDILTG